MKNATIACTQELCGKNLEMIEVERVENGSQVCLLFVHIAMYVCLTL